MSSVFSPKAPKAPKPLDPIAPTIQNTQLKDSMRDERKRQGFLSTFLGFNTGTSAAAKGGFQLSRFLNQQGD